MQFYLFLPQHRTLAANPSLVFRVRDRRTDAELDAKRELSRLASEIGYPMIVQPFDFRLEPDLVAWRLAGRVLPTLGVLGIFFAGFGIYIAITRLFVSRSREFAIRAALGSPPRDLIILGVREILYHVAIGVLLGFALVLACSPWLNPVLFETSITDLSAYVAALFGIALAAGGAGFFAARTQADIPPGVVLRK
jgi:hypothetical protein